MLTVQCIVFVVVLDRCIKMAIVHDLAESLVGDITPHDGTVEFFGLVYGA